MTAAIGTTHPKEGTFGGITVLMAPITTLTEETSGPYGVPWGVLVNSGALDGPCGVLGVLEDCLVRLEGFLWSWCR